MFSLKPDEVHIWSAHLSGCEKDIEYLKSILSEDEQQKANSFRFPKDQRSYIISRGILRRLLGKYLGQDPQEVEIVYGLWGKPCLVGQPLYFNLSHSKDYVLYALTSHCEVGIDLEYIDKNLNIEDMALSILRPTELEYWKTVKPEEKIDTFFKLWVCKEAFLKASGKGWLNDQQEILLEGVSLLEKDNKISKSTKKMAAPCCFESISGYASALFIEGPFLRLHYFVWNL